MDTKTGKRSLPKRGSKRASKKKTAKKSAAIPEKQWEMPAGFCSDGYTQATLREVVDPDQPTMQLSDLTLEQRAELVTKRLELQKEINLAMIGAGMIDKARAITEVKNNTKVGRLLIEIEHQMIRNLIEQSQKASSGAARKPRLKATSAAKSRSKGSDATKVLGSQANARQTRRYTANSTTSRGKAAKSPRSRRTPVAKTKSRDKPKR
jgi:hypothetical protein